LLGSKVFSVSMFHSVRMILSKHVNKRLRQHLECPICSEVKTDCHMLQCTNGHVACAKCHEETSKCPACSEDLVSPGIRNFRLEEIIAECPPLNCKHSGCVFESEEGYDRLRGHEEGECNYRPVQYPHTSCDKMVSLGKLEEHAVSQQKAKRRECSSEGTVSIEWSATDVVHAQRNPALSPAVQKGRRVLRLARGVRGAPARGQVKMVL
jgi:hypothetical protein